MRQFLLFLLSCSLSAAMCQGQAPVGPQFLVNTYTTGGQGSPAVAMGENGNFIVVWGGNNYETGDTSGGGIQGQRYSSQGIPEGPEFRINSYTTDAQKRSDLSISPNGNFVVVWQSIGSYSDDNSYSSIQGRLFSSLGSALGTQFQVNKYTSDSQSSPAVAMRSNGDFVVVWYSNGSNNGDDSFWSIQAQRFSSEGAPLGTEFLVNSYTTSYQGYPDVAMDPQGGFIVVWASKGSNNGDTSTFSIQGQRFSSTGEYLSSQFLVNSYTTSYQMVPDIGADSEGNFIVVWQSFGSSGNDTSDYSLQGQRFGSDGSSLGSQFEVNTYTSSYQRYPRIALEPEGDFVIVWESDGSAFGDSSFYSIQGQQFSSTGEALGQFQVNSYTSLYQLGPAVAIGQNGQFIVTWTSEGADDDTQYSSVQAQRYCEIFCDGFETGDLSAWSDTSL